MSLYSALTQVLAPFAAKIKGIQTGYDGTEYDSPGEAVREQINDLHVLIGHVPGEAIQASAVAYNDSNVGTELTNVNGRLDEQEEIVNTLNEGGLDIKDDVIEAQITNWLNDHPEATTTVQDGAITEAKLGSQLKGKIGANDLVDALDMMMVPFFQSNTSNTQGVCIVGDYLIFTEVFASPSTDTQYYVIDMVNKRVVSTYTASTGHSNSFAYNPADNCVYTVDGNTLYKLLFSNGSISLTDTITLENSFSACAYYGGVFYFRESNTQAVYITEDLETFTKLFDVDYGGLSGQTPQSIACDGEFLYMLTSSVIEDCERIFVYEKTRGELIKCYMLPSKTFGEIEGMGLYKGNAVISFNSSAKNVFVTPIRKVFEPVTTEPFKQTHTRPLNQMAFSVYVDNSKTYSFVDGTETNPFVSVNEALNVVQRLDLYAHITIKGTYDTVSIWGYRGRGNIVLDEATFNVLGFVESIATLKGTGTIKRINAQRSVLNIEGTTKIVLDGNNEADYMAISNYRSVIIGDVYEIKNYTGQYFTGNAGLTSIISSKEANVLPALLSIPLLYPKTNTIIMNGVHPQSSIPLVAEQDLNDLTCAGAIYRCTTLAIAASLLNCPTAKGFVMEVFRRNDNYVVQRITDSDGDTFIRNGSTSWGAWRVIHSEAIT